MVVPSPATSEVLDATSFTICAPMFAKRFSSSISLATVTPSLVMVGAPHDFSRSDVAAAWPEGHLHRIGERVEPVRHLFAGVAVVENFFGGHW